MFFILSPTSILCKLTWLLQARNLPNVIQRSVDLSLQLMYPTDSFGNICGRGEFSAKPLLLFFDLTKCASLTALAGCPTPQVTVSTQYLHTTGECSPRLLRLLRLGHDQPGAHLRPPRGGGQGADQRGVLPPEDARYHGASVCLHHSRRSDHSGNDKNLQTILRIFANITARNLCVGVPILRIYFYSLFSIVF